jgi:hypothetical protein
MRKTLTTTWLVLFIFTLLYVAGYGVARWRKFIVMREYHAKELQIVVRVIGSGWDVRDNGETSWPHLKNKLNPLILKIYMPLVALENLMYGSQKSIIAEH